MKKKKKYIVVILSCILFLLQIVPVYAEENDNTEWYEMIEEEYEEIGNIDNAIMPYTQYILNVLTSMTKISSSKLGLRADVQCVSTVKSITVTFYLQKYNGSSWTTVSSGTASTATNVSSTAKQMTVTGVSSGQYRAKTVTRVVDKYGYSESVTGYSGSITI